ncbi:MAG TPA: TRAP transporter substrate-binding protein [Woeseiaceae bacterium]|nr:TRAP transporter substrate-binding protein [Woeseiaceae bacterium]
MTATQARPHLLTRRQLLLAPLLLAACGDRGRTRPLFAAESQPDAYPTTQALHRIDQILDQRTGGEMRLRVYAGGQMGSENDTLEITIFGGLDLNRVNLAPLNPIIPETIVLALPFLFRSVTHLRQALDGVNGRRILDAMSPYELKGMCFYDSGERCFYNTRRPIYTPDDLKGLKIRVPSSDIYVSMIQALGANPTPIPYGEVYSALVQGVVDGAENNWPSYESSRHFEVARFYSLTRHVMAPDVLVASQRSWDRMSSEEQEHLQAATDESVPYMRMLWDQRDAEARSRVLAQGIELVEEVDHEAFASLMLPVWEKFLTTPALLDLSESIGNMETDDG